MAECHRKHAIRLLAWPVEGSVGARNPSGKRVYDEAEREAPVVLWEASDRIYAKRLKAGPPGKRRRKRNLSARVPVRAFSD